jgi:hypothetical protein
MRKTLPVAGMLLILIAFSIPAKAQKRGEVVILFDGRVPQEFSDRYSSFHTLFAAEVIKLLGGGVFKKYKIGVQFATMSYEGSPTRVPIIAITIDALSIPPGIPPWMVRLEDLSSPQAIKGEALKAASIISRMIKKLDGYKIKASPWDCPRAFIFVGKLVE